VTTKDSSTGPKRDNPPVALAQFNNFPTLIFIPERFFCVAKKCKKAGVVDPD
jgi:hypothetical protein